MMKNSKVVTAFGRRQFDKDEIDDGESDEDSPTEEEETKARLANIKPRYMRMFKKDEEEKDEEEEEEPPPDPKAFGLWDAVTNAKVLPTLMKVKKEWTPPNWEKTLDQLKEEGRDVKSIDKQLKEIQHEKEQGRKKTGKYLMPEDLRWCRKHCKFKEKDLLKWFRRFRSACPNGTMNKVEFATLFKSAFPLGEAESMAEAVFQLLDHDEEGVLDFKDFVLIFDVLNADGYLGKLRWAFHLVDNVQGKRGTIDRRNLPIIIRLLDPVEFKGYMEPPSEEEVDELMYRRNLDPMKLLEDRVEDVYEACEVDQDGRINLEAFMKTPERVIFSRD